LSPITIVAATPTKSAAEMISADQDQRGEGNRVDADDPLQFGYAAAERRADA
jgi:hypothetical protein